MVLHCGATSTSGQQLSFQRQLQLGDVPDSPVLMVNFIIRKFVPVFSDDYSQFSVLVFNIYRLNSCERSEINGCIK